MQKKPNNNSDYPNTYYAATAKYQLKQTELPNNLEVETCIIGGGYAALMTALGLIERGHKNIAIIEKNKIGWGCSGRNGGFISAGFSLGPKDMIKQIGLDKTRQLHQMTIDSIDLIRKRVKQYHIDCELVNEGLICANWFKDQNILLDEAKFFKEKLDLDWEYIPPEQLSEQLKTKRYHGGLHEKNAMHFHPLNYALGIADQIQKQGGQIFENCEVLDLDYSQNTKIIKTAQGNVRCKNIVLTGGGYIGKLCKPVSRSVLPITTYVMATKPLGNRLKDSINTSCGIFDTRFAFDYYRPLQDTRILWGGRIHANTKKPKNLHDLMFKDMLKVYPELHDVKVDFAWDGWMAYSKHKMAQIGQISPNVWYNIGFGGHGVCATTTGGEIVAQAITQENEHYKQFEHWGLPWNGGIAGPIAAQMTYWYYELKDWWKDRLESKSD